MKTEIETSDARVMAAAASNENLVILALLEATGQAGGLPRRKSAAAVRLEHDMLDYADMRRVGLVPTERFNARVAWLKSRITAEKEVTP